MKNQHESINTDAKPKMLFNSDGFEFLLKAITVLFKIMGMLLVVALNIVAALFETRSKKETAEDHTIIHYKEDGSGYNSDGDRVI
ncbi:hypothetical protein RHO13_01770 [Orbus wheelerorum]|uniref:hypothetical protein n=1 Tax=Orbus wheelerorum TaxID=3074111 RepID=UPI00370D8792